MRFSYKGVDESGASDTGVLEAGSEHDAFMTLRSRGITVFELVEGDEPSRNNVPWYRRDIELFGSGLPLGEQATVAETMGVLFELRLPLNDTLHMLEHAVDSPRVRRHFVRTGQRVADGEPLAEAFQAAGAGFSPMFHILLRVSDAANTLSQTMSELSTYLRNQERVRAKLKSALIYPTVLVLASLGLLLVIVFYLAPSLEPMFSAVDKPMPGSIALFLSIGDLLREDGWLVLSVLVAVSFAGLIFTTGWHGQNLQRAIIRRLPVWGRISRQAELLRQVRAINMLLKSGMPYADALETVARFMGAGGAQFEAAAEQLKQGGQASEVFASDRALPAIARDLLRVGEETNRLPDVLASLSRSLEDRLDAATQKAMQTITPTLTLGLGLAIGLLIYQVMGAVLEINELAF